MFPTRHAQPTSKHRAPQSRQTWCAAGTWAHGSAARHRCGAQPRSGLVAAWQAQLLPALIGRAARGRTAGLASGAAVRIGPRALPIGVEGAGWEALGGLQEPSLHAPGSPWETVFAGRNGLRLCALVAASCRGLHAVVSRVRPGSMTHGEQLTHRPKCWSRWCRKMRRAGGDPGQARFSCAAGHGVQARPRKRPVVKWIFQSNWVPRVHNIRVHDFSEALISAEPCSKLSQKLAHQKQHSPLTSSRDQESPRAQCVFVRRREQPLLTQMLPLWHRVRHGQLVHDRSRLLERIWRPAQRSTGGPMTRKTTWTAAISVQPA